MRFLRKLKRGIKNCIVWFPTIWNDGQWDHYFLYKILRKKLELIEYQRKYIALTVVTKKEIRKITTAKNLCERIASEDYAWFDGRDLRTPFTFRGDVYKYEKYMTKQDLELLTKILKTQSLMWWD